MNELKQDSLMSLRQAATRLNISTRALYRLIARKEIARPVKVGGSSKLCESDLDTYLTRLKQTRKA